jgi:hypothetical protein
MSRYLNEPGLTDGTLITDTAALAGNWCAIQIVEATVFNVLTSTTLTVQGALADATFAAGIVIYGNFTTIDLTSGAVVAYNAT